jgi:formiminotetrahydrofolate cyclodeaminase
LLADLKIKQYLERAAAGTAVPGGGSVAALNAALAAGLTEMVANLTVGKKGYEAVEEKMRTIARQAADLRQALTVAIDTDAEAYGEVMDAYKLPQETEDQKQLRREKIQEAFKLAARVPLEVATHAARVLGLAEKAIDSGNKNAVSDGLVAAMNARTAALAALYNVKINLASIEDDEFVKKLAAEVNRLEKRVAAREKEILSRARI